MQWMLYGATGFTGQLVIETALARGHRPLLAGRNVDKLDVLAQQYDLEYVAFRLDDVKTIGEAIAEMDVVYHAAGPFKFTSDPMIRACLATNTHYLDITGELPVFENTFRYDKTARANGIALISGVGYDVVPSDCVAAYVAQQVSGATQLEIAVIPLSNPTAGTVKSAIEVIPEPYGARQNGQLVKASFGKHKKELTLGEKTFTVYSSPYADLSTAYHATGIPNITTYAYFSSDMLPLLKVFGAFGGALFKPKFIRNLIGRYADRNFGGPDEQARENSSAYVWAKASNRGGQVAEAWLRTKEVYQYTAEVSVLAIERVMELHPVGALSPAQAFGADFALEVDGTQRHDSPRVT